MFGKYGSGEGEFEFSDPRDVTVDSQGYIYVTDSGNHRVQKFSPKYEYISSFSTEGLDEGQMVYPSGITVDDRDNLYINHRDWVSIFSTNGEFIHRFRKEGKSFKGWLNNVLFAHGNLYVCMFNKLDIY